MKAWIQRVSEASVTIDGEVVSSIGQGFLVLLGVTHSDTVREADDIAARIATLRAAVRSGSMAASASATGRTVSIYALL